MRRRRRTKAADKRNASGEQVPKEEESR